MDGDPLWMVTLSGPAAPDLSSPNSPYHFALSPSRAEGSTEVTACTRDVAQVLGESNSAADALGGGRQVFGLHHGRS